MFESLSACSDLEGSLNLDKNMIVFFIWLGNFNKQEASVFVCKTGATMSYRKALEIRNSECFERFSVALPRRERNQAVLSKNFFVSAVEKTIEAESLTLFCILYEINTGSHSCISKRNRNRKSLWLKKLITLI